ncbi:sperm-associated antigen 16 protein-like [Periophthalmus magnuspinnatus]|uniref:sperm-associated antigen 16 protein-like n=1 Tax=Periophthalmus magnuspinnatus TaxID=409849 RepID=UPI0024364974|nr:sperm-associated antigen 16 protein-like [Periophthalmus magnuspinnatus]
MFSKNHSLDQTVSDPRLRTKGGQLWAVTPIPETVDDFLRNFLLRLGLVQTLDCFQREWYQNQDQNQDQNQGPKRFVPDALTQQTLLQSELAQRREEAELLQTRVLDLNQTLMRLKHERNFHRERSVSAEVQKGALCADLAQLKQHHDSLEPALARLTRGHETALRARTLIAMETEEEVKRDGFMNETGPAHFTLLCSIRAHHQPISNVEIHPIKRLLASSSDDRTWRLWELPTNQEKVGALLLSGEGHSDWLTSCSFSPEGGRLATTSGDATVRVWDLDRGRCLLSLPGHLSSTWGCCFHRSGLSLASGSSDWTVRLWDLPGGRALATLRRHGKAVSSVHFPPHSDHFLLSSGRDGTLLLWDTRAPASHQATHRSAINHCTTDTTGRVVASCDAGGVVNLWDVRAFRSPLCSAHTAAGANQVSFCPGGSEEVAVAGGDGLVRVLRMSSGHVTELSGHVGQACSVRFDHQGETLLSAGTDGHVRVWSRTTRKGI